MSLTRRSFLVAGAPLVPLLNRKIYAQSFEPSSNLYMYASLYTRAASDALNTMLAGGTLSPDDRETLAFKLGMFIGTARDEGLDTVSTQVLSQPYPNDPSTAQRLYDSLVQQCSASGSPTKATLSQVQIMLQRGSNGAQANYNSITSHGY